MNVILLAILSIGMSVLAQFALRAGMSRYAAVQHLEPVWHFALKQPMLYLGFLLYGASAVVWLGVLARWEVSKAYPMVGLGFALTVLVGYLLGEQVGLTRALGVLLICAGVVLVGRS